MEEGQTLDDPSPSHRIHPFLRKDNTLSTDYKTGICTQCTVLSKLYF